MVKRYKISSRAIPPCPMNGYDESDSEIVLEQNEEGKWVKYEAYRLLEKENEKLKVQFKGK